MENAKNQWHTLQIQIIILVDPNDEEPISNSTYYIDFKAIKH